MITELRAADPAADRHPSATSPAAEAMLQQVLATPRAEARPHRRGRRLAYAVAGAAALAAGTAVLTGLATSSPDARAAGYTVARHADGSVEVSIEFDEFRDPAAFQRSLRAQGVRAVVLSGDLEGPPPTLVSSDPATGTRRYEIPIHRVRACAKYRSMDVPDHGGTGDEPYEFRFKGALTTRLILRPSALPADGTYVFELDDTPDPVQGVRVFSMAVALGPPPTCLG